MRFAMPAPRTARFAASLALAAVLCGCASGPSRQADRAPGAERALPRDADGPGANPPADLASLADAEPRVEPIRPGGANKPYQALGRDYVPLARDVPFNERGLASWYGRKFHGQRTASGEVYDMYSMTAAHPTLPIPSYARIRNPANGREVLVRVNDRGPFVPGRIVDLSYAAAFKLDLLRGVAPVELERITFDEIRTGAWRGAPVRLAAVPPETARASPSAVVEVPAQDVAFASTNADADAAAVASAPAHASAPANASAPAIAMRATTASPPVTLLTVASVDDRPRPGRAAAQAARGFWVQLGAFRERDRAESFRRRVGADGESAWLEPHLAIFGEATPYRVQAGPYLSRDEAEGAAQRARSALGIVPVVVERR